MQRVDILGNHIRDQVELVEAGKCVMAHIRMGFLERCPTDVRTGPVSLAGSMAVEKVGVEDGQVCLVDAVCAIGSAVICQATCYRETSSGEDGRSVWEVSWCGCGEKFLEGGDSTGESSGRRRNGDVWRW